MDIKTMIEEMQRTLKALPERDIEEEKRERALVKELNASMRAECAKNDAEFKQRRAAAIAEREADFKKMDDLLAELRERLRQ